MLRDPEALPVNIHARECVQATEKESTLTSQAAIAAFGRRSRGAPSAVCADAEQFDQFDGLVFSVPS